MSRYPPITLLAALYTTCLTGCEGPTKTISDLQNQIVELQRENRTLTDTVEVQDKKIDKLKDAIANLQPLGAERLEKLYSVSKVEIDQRLTAGADYDGHPGDDGITLYLNLYDQQGDAFKAAGEIDVYIHDLADPKKHTLIAEYHFDVDAAAEKWYGRFLTYHYKIKCPWQVSPPKGRDIQIQVLFLDYLTGEVHQAWTQTQITPLPADYPTEEQ